MRKHLRFNTSIGRKKPESILNREAACPFCDRQNLTDVLAEDGPILLVKNKYPVLEDTFPTVLIETDRCDQELSIYEKEHLYRVIRFGMNKWLEMEKSGEFASVMFFKNHGPYSGGTIHHPHMQIIGLHQYDYLHQTHPEDFEGIFIAGGPGVACNLSTKPRAGFFEFNVLLRDAGELPRFADYIQMLAHYILNHLNRRCQSYNLFFYRLQEEIAVKVVPRYVTSPLLVGYSIPQVPNNLHDVVREIREHYL